MRAMSGRQASTAAALSSWATIQRAPTSISRGLASQGAAIGRAGLLHIAIEDAHIRVGGMAVTCIDGQMAY
ncbi:MAG TPA: hypothetical protein VIZ86_15425 [Pseudomonas sp.]